MYVLTERSQPRFTAWAVWGQGRSKGIILKHGHIWFQCHTGWLIGIPRANFNVLIYIGKTCIYIVKSVFHYFSDHPSSKYIRNTSKIIEIQIYACLKVPLRTIGSHFLEAQRGPSCFRFSSYSLVLSWYRLSCSACQHPTNRAFPGRKGTSFAELSCVKTIRLPPNNYTNGKIITWQWENQLKIYMYLLLKLVIILPYPCHVSFRRGVT